MVPACQDHVNGRRKMAHNDKQSGGGFLSGFVVGGIVGFLTGMVLAPRSGDETRMMFSERGQELRDKADELFAAARERMAAMSPERQRRPEYPYDDLDFDEDL